MMDMAFEAILGQERLIENLKKALNRQQISHAYLLEGEKGLGKRKVAYEIAKGICCRGEEKRPCNECTSCKKLQHGNHPEVKWLQEETSIKIESIRQIQKNLQMKPYEGSKKVYIICDAEKMTIQAQNALLKTLEEPPEYATILLLTTNAVGLLPTITSRCQRLKLLPVSMEKIQNYLVGEKGITLEEAKVMAAFSNGAIGKALQLMEDEAFKNRRKETIRMTRDIMDKNTIQLLETMNFFNQEKDNIEEILEIMMGWYRDLLIYKDTKKKEYTINIDEIQEIFYQADKLILKNIKEMILIIERTKNNFRSNVNFQLNLEVMLLDLKQKAKI
ncbi:DNA polymerase III, delta prime subunit [Natronincola peptidivorans]|uniref:DNA polymerase III subunit delta' n=1 Tax=Natronincola peptidivorans TaxID=426128 RepID=A0A1I0CV36_9FIRM|nr:DNA polymerase III subunit delta' [Natronincola peptidivorans]SET23592.1 DNA polymerase III, delta prime subunit [Natronincola peptidivorans]